MWRVVAAGLMRQQEARAAVGRRATDGKRPPLSRLPHHVLDRLISAFVGKPGPPTPLRASS